jgi:hypothetical protein
MAWVNATSQFRPGAHVQIDPYTANPLLQDASQAVPETVQAATASNGDAPRMFSGGTDDLPPFTASGADPDVLLRLPYQLRHSAATDPSAQNVLTLIEQHTNDPDTMLTPGADAATSPGLADYIGRFHDWLAGRWTNPNFQGPDPAAAAAGDDAVFNSLFGEQDRRLSAQRDAVAAASPPMPRTAEAKEAFNRGRAQR